MYALARCQVLLIGIVALLVSGCAKPGPTVIEVHGTVTYKGQPVTTGMVKFSPVSADAEVSRPAVGAISAEGTYQMAAFPGRNGSRPGEYQVAIVAYTGSFMDGTAKYVVPKRFADPKTSGLKVTVPADATEPLVLDLSLQD